MKAEDFKSIEDPSDAFTCEQVLCCAMLTRAIRDALGDTYPWDRHRYPAGHKKIVRNAEAWLWAHSTTEFSFVWVCEHLSVDPEALRATVEELQNLPDGLRVMSARLDEYRIMREDYAGRNRAAILLKMRDKMKNST